jgi:hypothetical protein
MRPEKRKNIKSFFLSVNKKARQKARQESIVLDPSSSSPNVRSDSYFFDQNPSISSPSIDETFDEIYVIENSRNESMSVDISRTCYARPSQRKFSSYSLKFENRSFRSNWLANKS